VTLVATASAVMVLGAGGALTKLGPWYEKLQKPSWQPPGWLFGPAWTVIGGLTVWSAVIAWTPLRSRSERRRLILLFAANGVLNVLWSLLFFNRRRPDWALIEVVPLWLSVAALIGNTAPRTPRAAWLLAPYLAWVSFAAFLNLTIVRLNPHSRSEPA
jgi:tryptophan-rich sensory protein